MASEYEMNEYSSAKCQQTSKVFNLILKDVMDVNQLNPWLHAQLRIRKPARFPAKCIQGNAPEFSAKSTIIA